MYWFSSGPVRQSAEGTKVFGAIFCVLMSKIHVDMASRKDSANIALGFRDSFVYHTLHLHRCAI